MDTAEFNLTYRPKEISGFKIHAVYKYSHHFMFESPLPSIPAAVALKSSVDKTNQFSHWLPRRLSKILAWRITQWMGLKERHLLFCRLGVSRMWLTELSVEKWTGSSNSWGLFRVHCWNSFCLICLSPLWMRTVKEEDFCAWVRSVAIKSCL